VALEHFLASSTAGLAFRALVGEAQHDPVVRDLVTRADLLADSTQVVLERVRLQAASMPEPVLSRAQLIGPVVTQLLTTNALFPRRLLKVHVATLLRAWA
jgi:hypothetical protein